MMLMLPDLALLLSRTILTALRSRQQRQHHGVSNLVLQLLSLLLLQLLQLLLALVPCAAFRRGHLVQAAAAILLLAAVMAVTVLVRVTGTPLRLLAPC